MNLTTDRAFMLDSLSSLLEEGETLQAPVYGCLMERGFFPHNYFGFFGLTESQLLIAILNPFDGKRIDWVNRVPLRIRRVTIRKSLVLFQYTVKLRFLEGNPCRLRLSTKLFCGDFDDQAANVTAFLDGLRRYA